MEIRDPELDINKENPFEGAFPGRESTANSLLSIAECVAAPAVISLDAPWGTGKTTFLKMCHQKLLNEKSRSVYLNAWQSDYLDDPLLALITAIEESFGSDSGMFDNAKRFAGKVAIACATTALKAATAGLIDVRDDIDAVIEGGVSDFVDSVSKQYVSDYKGARDAQRKLRQCIADLAGSHEGNVVIFVDELDRCRPTYALQLLERIKHVFDVPQVVFILAIDQPAICSVVRATYGSEFQAKDYLRRFLDLPLKLPRAGFDVSHLHSDQIGGGIMTALDPSALAVNQHVFNQLCEAFEINARQKSKAVVRSQLCSLAIPHAQANPMTLLHLTCRIMIEAADASVRDAVKNNPEHELRSRGVFDGTYGNDLQACYSVILRETFSPPHQNSEDYQRQVRLLQQNRQIAENAFSLTSPLTDMQASARFVASLTKTIKPATGA